MSTPALRPKHRAFVAAYIGVANYNATEAARLAGYKQPHSQGPRLLENVETKAAIDAHLASIEAEGLAHRTNRVRAANERHRLMHQLREARAADMAGEIAGGETGLLVRQHKMLGSGEYGREVTEYTFDAALMRELRELEKQVAQDLGQWSERHQVSGPDGGPLPIRYIEVAVDEPSGEGDDDEPATEGGRDPPAGS